MILRILTQKFIQLLGVLFLMVLFILLFYRCFNENENDNEWPNKSKFSETMAFQLGKERQYENSVEYLPFFYFYVDRLSYPDTFYKIKDKTIRNELEGLLQKYGNWKEISDYFHSKKKLKISDYSLTELKNDGIIRLNDFHKAKKKLDQRQTHWKNYLPKIVFTRENHFHSWLIKFISKENREKLIVVIDKLLQSTILILLSLLSSLCISVPIGIFISEKTSTFKKSIEHLNLIILALPTFVIITFLLLFFSRYTDIIGDYYQVTIFNNNENGNDFSSGINRTFLQLALPGAILVILYSSNFILLTKNIVDEGMAKPYILSLRAKGLSETKLKYKHALKDGGEYFLTYITSTLISSLTGIIIIESVFSIPGIGSEINFAVQNDDKYSLINMLFIFTVFTYSVLTLSEIIKSYLLPFTKMRNL